MDEETKKLINEERYSEVIDVAINYYVKYDFETAADIYNELYDAVAETEGRNSEKAMDVLSRLADTYSRCDNYEDSISLYKCVLEWRKNNYGEENNATLETMMDLAYNYEMFGKLNEKLEICKSVLSISLKNNGENHYVTIRAILAIGDCYYYMEQSQKAVAYYEHSIRLLENQNEKNMVWISETYDKLGRAQEQLCLYDDAFESYTKGYDILKEMSLEESEIGLIVLNDIANIYDSKQMYDEELELKLRLLKLSEKLYGKMHYNVNMARYNLATAYIHTGEFDKCIELRKQAYEWFLSQLGEKNSSTLLAMSALAADYERCGETEKALELTERVYRLRYEMFGETKRETLYSYIRLGNCYFECHKIYQAMTVAQKATEICENIGIKDSSEYCSARSLYARICNETEQYSSALEATKEIEGICCDKDILQLANTYNIMADTLCHSGDYVNGLAYQMRDVDINTEAFGENHRYTIAEKYELAGCYFDCRMYSRSLELLQQLEQIGEEKYISASDMYYRKALLARALSATGEDVEGEAVINTLLNDIDESVGEDDCSDIYYAAAEIYFNSGKYPTALKYINKSLQLRIKIYPENARTLLRTYDLLKKIERKLKDETV